MRGRCETVRGSGRVVKIVNATRWHPAWVDVVLDGEDQGRRFRGDEVWEEGKERDGKRA